MSKSQKTLAMLETVQLRHAIEEIKNKANESVAVDALCKDYLARLDNGQCDAELCEPFILDMSKLADAETTGPVLATLSDEFKSKKDICDLIKSVCCLKNGNLRGVSNVIEANVVKYLLDRSRENRNELRDNLSIFANDPTVKIIYKFLDSDDALEDRGISFPNAELKAEYVEDVPHLYTESEVNAIIEHRVSEAKKQMTAPKAKKTVNEMANHINLHGVIANILKENSHNDKLRIFCESYIDALNAGKPDEVLYESFISGISNWNYLNAVDTEVSALNDRVGKYKEEIDIKKILETMMQTGSYYIVPLIEDVVIDYAENKNMKTKALMLQRLASFEYDTFVRDIMNVALRDQSIGATVYLGESLEMCNQYVKSETVFSPVRYINEGETVFNIRGTFYKRSGDNVSKLNRTAVAALDESFRNLCALVNSSNVVINEALNTITVFSGNSDKAVISESEIRINGSKVKTGDLDKLSRNARLMLENEKAAFYAAVKVLNENFDTIANVDFVKRISARDNSGLCVDVFRINENICVNTINAALGKSTFYKNVNPIQCRKYINEHMGINVSPMFEDILPDQENTKKSIDEKKREYEDYIEYLESKKDALEKMKDESSDVDDIENAIEMIDKEIEDTKDDYKKYQKDADAFLNGDDEGDDDDDEKKGHEEGDDEGDEDGDTPKETPADMEQPLTNDNGADDDVDDDTDGDVDDVDAEPDEYADVPEFDPDFDVAISIDDTGDSTPEEGENAVVDGDGRIDGYRVVSVSYNKNVKTGKTSNKGEVIVIIPSVDANGDVHDDMRKITFMLDADRTPIVNNEYMPLAMYNAIVDAINVCPDTEKVSVEDAADPDDSDDDPEPDGGGDVPTVDGTDGDTDVEDFTKMISQDNGDGAMKAIDNILNNDSDDGSDDSDDDEEDDSDDDDDAEVEIAARETPAETEENGDKQTYPVSLGIYPEEIEPMEMEDFKSHLDKMKIDHSESEAKDGELCITVKNKAQNEAFKKFIKEWFNYTDDNVKAFVPELCRPEGGKKMIKESAKVARAKKGSPLRVIIPATKEYADMFGFTLDEGVAAITIMTENEKEAQYVYTKLYEHSKSHDVDADVQDILEHYAPKYGAFAEKSLSYSLTVPYNGFLESKLSARGLDVQRVNENINVEVSREDYRKTAAILESVYGNEVPASAKKFIDFVNESLVITVKDESTGKSVSLNVDDVLDDDKKGNDADFDSSFKDSTTFNTEDSLMFNDDEESADDEDEEGDETEDEEKKDEKKDKKLKEEEEGSDDGETVLDTEDEPAEDKDKDKKSKKKFKLKSKKTHESVDVKDGEPLNESVKLAEPTVYDWVKVPNGQKGQIVCKFADGTFIVAVEGHTIPYKKSELKMVTPRPDAVEPNMKFDEVTLALKGLAESYVSCGMFLNDMCVTPHDCKVKLMEYNSANDNDEIDIIMEGTAVKATKKFVRITENLNNVLDIANYAEGKMTLNVNGRLDESDVLINIADYLNYKNVKSEVCPVRTLVFDENNETHMKYVNGTCLQLNESSDVYVPEYINDLKRAILLTSQN